MLAFGQIELFIESDFEPFLKSFLTIPTFVLSINMSSISKEQIDISLDSNCIKYLDKNLETWFYWSFEAHRLLWPKILYILLVIFFLKIVQIYQFKHVPENPKYLAILEKK